MMQKVCAALSAILLPLLIHAADSVPTRRTAVESQVQANTLTTERLAAPLTYHLYLPPQYERESERRFPVVYWLHGSRGSSKQASAGVAGMFDDAIRAGTMPPAIVVFPDGLGQSMWVDSKDGKVPMETVLVRELVPHIDTQLRTQATPAARLVEGASMGGYGAARLGLKYPDVFGAASLLSAGPMQEVLDPQTAPIVGAAAAQATLDRVYGGDPMFFRAQSPWALAESTSGQARDALVLRILVGADDGVLDDNRKFSAHLGALGIEHEFLILPDTGHAPAALFGALRDNPSYWAFFRRVLGAATDAQAN